MLTTSWELLVQHRAGSLDAAIGSLRRRNLVISFGILLMLASSVVLAVVSSHRARALAQLQMDFVARVSHELRTPLAIIRSAAYNVATGVVSDENDIREYASMMQTEGQRLSTMVDQILSFSRSDTGPATYNLRAVQVPDIVDRVLETMASALSQSRCEIDQDIAGNLPKVKADATALAECLQNLLSNAIKYGRNEPVTRIRIDARRTDNNTVTISVEDAGPGIEPPDLPHIFEPFFRGRNVRSDAPGSGLGLNLVRRMMNAQGGRVTVESEPGHGARFTLHLTTVIEAVS
jgi:signal transduction histidine kinase